MLLALSAVLCALSLICLYLSVILDFNTLVFLTVSSFLMGVVLIEGKLKYFIYAYFTTAALSFLILPDKMIALSFTCFFGIYPAIKLYIEKLKNIYTEWSVKIILFMITAAFGLKAITLFLQELPANLPYALLTLLAAFVLCIYDYALSLLFSYYENKLRKHINIRGR